MLLFVLLAGTFLSSLGIQVAAGVLVLVLAAAVSSFVSRRRVKGEERQREEQTIIERLDSLTVLAQSMHAVLVGQEETDLNPNPLPGLVKIVPDLMNRTKRIETTLFTNGGKQNTVLDRMERMERTLNKGVAGVTRVEANQKDGTTGDVP